MNNEKKTRVPADTPNGSNRMDLYGRYSDLVAGTRHKLFRTPPKDRNCRSYHLAWYYNRLSHISAQTPKPVLAEESSVKGGSP